ncbi:MAG: hypothetical protein U0103_01900 [Candidatus Obscuribacterales bacterium]|nr:hypothetical protein [Cyanobacteria bacterium SZAS LIN-5]
MSPILYQAIGRPNTARRVIRGLTISLGLLAASVAYAAVITPILVRIIGNRKHPVDEPIDVAWIEEDSENDAK